MTDEEVLLAEGKPVRLADGSERNLQFRNEQALTLEKRYGGIRNFSLALRQNSLETTANTFALLFNVSPQKALALVDAKQLGKYVAAITDSLVEFFGLDIPQCVACGEVLPGEAKFCPSCGTAVPEQGEVESQGTERNSPPPGQDSSMQPWSSSELTRTASGGG